MIKKKFDASIHRKMFWSDEIPNKKICPECNSKLENEYHTYIILIKNKNDVIPLIAGHDGGYFCPKCPIIVLDREIVSELALATNPPSTSFWFTSVGIVDLNAIPPEKAHLPIDCDDNPIPLVEFIRESSKDDSNKKDRGKRRSSSRKHRKRK